MASTHAVSSTEPTDELDPDEPRTPGWMPLLGLAVFVVGGVAFAKYGPTQQNFPKAQAEASAPAAASAAAPQQAPQAPRAPGVNAGAAPNPMGRGPTPPQQGG